MAHEIKEGYIQIVKCVTPGCFWIKCGNCASSCKVPESIRWKPYSGEYYPSQGVKVFVHDPDGFFYRGTICGQRGGQSPSCKYVIHLVDTYQIKDFDLSDIYPSFDEVSVNCEGFHLVSLHNALPSIPPSNFINSTEEADEACREFSEKIQKWDAYNPIVENVLRGNVSLRYENAATIDGASFGTISLTDCNFRDHLAKLKVLSKVTFRFEKVVRVLKSPRLHISDTVFPAVSHKFVDSSKTYKTNVDAESKMYRLYEPDRELYERLTKQFHITILLADPPQNKDLVVRLINHQGIICLATIINPKVSHYRTVLNMMTKGEKFKKMLNSFYRQQENGVGGYFKEEASYERNQPSRLPSSSDESDQSDAEDESQNGMFEYDFDESARQFIQEGGIVENVSSLHPLPEHFHAIHLFIEGLFNLLNVEKLDKWQEICFPSLLQGKNLLIIGAKSRKMTTIIIGLLGCVGYSKTISEEKESSHPKCVIIVNDYKRAYDIATTCNKLSNVKVLVSTCSIITDTQVAQAKEGCDVLITSPTNWCKLTNDLKCFNYSDVGYYVFDSLEKMHSCYSEDLKTIFEALKCVKTQKSQIIILSNSWNSSIVGYVKYIDPPARIVIDIVQSAFCYGLKPTVVFTNNWQRQLVKIIEDDKATKRLLLCENYSQVEAIEEATGDLQDVLYINEKYNRAEILKCINTWISGEKTFLVCSDVLFREVPFVDDVNILVSWTLNPINWSSLTKRFKTILGHKPEERNNLTVYIFCSSVDPNSLLFVKENLSQVKGCGYIGGQLSEFMNNVAELEDLKKIEESICPSILMFGSCENYHHCSSRHCHFPSDNISKFRTNHFLKIELVKINSVFHFTVRVTDVVGNAEIPDTILNELCSNLSEIEEGLLAAYENVMEDGLHAKVCVNDIVGLHATNEQRILRRVRVLKIEEDSDGNHFEVAIMDYKEPNRRVRRQDIFPIPKEIKSFPSDLIDVYIAGLLPNDFKSDWYHETSSFIINFINLLQNNTKTNYDFLSGSIELAINRHVIVNSIYWCRQMKSNSYPLIVYGSLKECIMKSGYVRNNPKHIEQLSHFIKVQSPPVPNGRFGYGKMPANSSAEVYVTALEDPSLFYVQLQDENNRFAAFVDDFNNLMNTFGRSNLRLIARNELCVLNIEGSWNRAIVVAIDDKNDSTRHQHSKSIGPTLDSVDVTVMCVDFGDERIAKTSELFCLPESSYRIPFFAFECQLVGIKPAKGDNWSEIAVEKFGQYVRNGEECVLLYINFFGVAAENTALKYYRHQVSLTETKAGSLSVNQQLVEKGVAIWDETTVDLLINRKMKDSPGNEFRRSRPN